MTKAFIGYIIAVMALIIVGVVMLYSTGAYARDAHGDALFFIKRQGLFLCIGLVACTVVSFLDYNLLQRYWKWLFAAAVVLLLAVFLFPKVNGAHRWIKFGGLSFQPSELGKLAALTFLATWYSQYQGQVRTFRMGYLYPLAIVGILMVLIGAEVDVGTMSLIGATTLLLMYAAEVRKLYLFISGFLGLAGIAGIVYMIPQRMARFMAFLDLEATKEGLGFQQFMGLIALGSGGVYGKGLGNGRQKMEFLPFAHTDFIFPMIGEELGLIGTASVVAAYVLLVVCGIVISIHARDRFGALLAFSITAMWGVQAAINIGVTTALLPNKGIALPFISYGGSSLVFSLIEVGLMISIYRFGLSEQEVQVKSPLPVRRVVIPRI